jgi:hypothetical protein
MDLHNRGAPLLPQEPGAGRAPSRWSRLGEIDPDEAKTAPQPAIKVHQPRQARSPAAFGGDPDDTKTAPQPAIRIPPGHEARPAPFGSQAAPDSARQVPGTRPAGYDEHGLVPGMWRRTDQRRTRPDDPSWLRVLANTFTLWVTRRGRRDKRRDDGLRDKRRSSRWLRVAALVVVVLVAAGAGVALSRHSTSANPSQDNGVLTAQAARGQAASWIAAQVGRNTIVSCDPVMCSVLQAHGYPVGNLNALGPNAPDPLDSDLIAATSVLRSQFGSRLTSVYAPLLIAKFGTGSAEVDVRAVAPDGGPVYRSQFSADLAARKTLGAELLRDPKIAAEPAARRALADGLVDARLLATISTLSDLHPLSIVEFGDASPGAAAGVALRSATLLSGIGGSSSSAAGLGALATFLRGQQPPYLPAITQIVRLTSGDSALRVQFTAPAPLGLLNTGQTDAGQPIVKIPAT